VIKKLFSSPDDRPEFGSGSTAEFKRRKPMSARAKQAISRALKGKKKKRSKRKVLSDVLLGGTPEGTRVRANLMYGALGAGVIASVYAQRSAYRAEKDAKRREREGFSDVPDQEALNRIKAMQQKMESFEAAKKAVGSDVKLDKVKQKYQSKIDKEMGVYLAARKNREKASSMRQIFKEDIASLGTKAGRAKAYQVGRELFRRTTGFKNSSRSGWVAEFRKAKKRRKPLSQLVKLKISKALRDREARRLHPNSRAAVAGMGLGAIAGGIAGSRLDPRLKVAIDATRSVDDLYASRVERYRRIDGASMGALRGAALGTVLGGFGHALSTSGSWERPYWLKKKKKRRGS
jgi:hypothetical protein